MPRDFKVKLLVFDLLPVFVPLPIFLSNYKLMLMVESNLILIINISSSILSYMTQEKVTIEEEEQGRVEKKAKSVGSGNSSSISLVTNKLIAKQTSIGRQ